MSARRPRPALLAEIALLLLVLALYAATLDTGLQPGELEGGDLITHQYAQVQARPGNAPGYPLYTMGGWLWFHAGRALVRAFGPEHPNPIPILSSYSVLWALIAVWLLYRVVLFVTRSTFNLQRTTAEHATAGAPDDPVERATFNVERENWPAAWLIAAFYAVTYFFWYYATTTEQYGSAVAQTLAIVYVYFLWREQVRLAGLAGSSGWEARPTAAERFGKSLYTRRADRLLALLAFLCGLALAHMLTVAFIAPPLVIAVLWERPGLLRRGRLLLAVAGAALLPLLAYAYVYVRGAQHPEWWGRGDWPNAWAWFRAFVSTAQGREELGWGFEPGRAFFGNGFPALIWGELSVPVLILGLIGIALLGRKPAFVLYTTLAIYLAFAWAYRYGNWYQVILPAYPLILIGLGALVNRVQKEGKRQKAEGKRAWGAALAAGPPALLVAAVIWRGATSLPRADSRGRPGDTALDRAAVLLGQPLPERAGLFAAVGDALALDYLINVWGLRPDLRGLRVVSSPDAAGVPAAGDPLLATWEAAPVLLDEIAAPPPPLRALSPDWAAFDPEPDASPAPQITLDATPVEGVRLLGATIAPAPSGAPVTAAEPGLDVTLFWELAGGAWPDGLNLSLRPTLGGEFIPWAGGVIQRDAGAPLAGLLAAAQMEPGAPLADPYRLPLPAPLPAGADGLAVILYRSAADGGFDVLADLRLPLS